jgi:DNA polymerase II small subunit/DNA polymerase delta subunit B
MGPFLDVANPSVEAGDISFKKQGEEVPSYLDYSELFQLLMKFIRDELAADNLTTKVVIIPSHKEVHHAYPLPSPPFSDSLIPPRFDPVLASNPAVLRVNDITIAAINADSIKDVCLNMIVKGKEEVQGGKLTLAFESLF